MMTRKQLPTHYPTVKISARFSGLSAAWLPMLLSHLKNEQTWRGSHPRLRLDRLRRNRPVNRSPKDRHRLPNLGSVSHLQVCLFVVAFCPIDSLVGFESLQGDFQISERCFHGRVLSGSGLTTRTRLLLLVPPRWFRLARRLFACCPAQDQPTHRVLSRHRIRLLMSPALARK